jgi:hypothetical protein
MSKGLKSLDKRRMSAISLIFFGRFFFVFTAIYAFSHILFGWPPHLFGIVIGIMVAAVLLLLAAYLLRDFGWLWQMPVIGIAFAGLTIGGSIFKVYFARHPHHLTTYEACVGLLGRSPRGRKESGLGQLGFGRSRHRFSNRGFGCREPGYCEKRFHESPYDKVFVGCRGGKLGYLEGFRDR